ncbi:MAG: hypothetical protein JW751_26425 [Polyangiaceae bacterium]|nr:hypothetical protein [Polyangiaceae bacterium]
MSHTAWLGEGVGLDVVTRAERELAAALRRRPTAEGSLAGCLRELASVSPRLLLALAGAAEAMVRRDTMGRPLYVGAIRAVATQDPERAGTILERALAREDAGGLTTLSACGAIPVPHLRVALARVAAGRHPQLAFAAEVARIARGETDGAHIATVAPKIKESHRLALCTEVFVPLRARPALPVSIAAALRVLRDAERHLGRWLVFAEVATRAGDPVPLAEARERSTTGPESSRVAWSLLAWALAEGPPPEVRPSAELVARLSDRPSTDRDPTFLFRLAGARVPTVRVLLEHLARGPGLRDAVSVRAALYLARDHARDDLRRALLTVVESRELEALRGLAAAALQEVSEPGQGDPLLEPLFRSRKLPTVTWAVLARARARGWLPGDLVTEGRVRHIEHGWAE